MGFLAVLIIAFFTLFSDAFSRLQPEPSGECQFAHGPLCAEICSLRPFVDKVVKQVKSCLNDTSWALSSSTPMILVPVSNDTQGLKKTFTWRQLDVRPGETRNACRRRCMRRRKTDKSKVKSVKDLGQRTNTDGGHRPTRSEVEEIDAGNPEIQKDEGQTHTEQGGHDEHEPELCLPGQKILIYEQINHCRDRKRKNGSSDQETHTHIDDEKCEDAVWKATCSEVEGVCPGMTALSCLVSMKAKSDEDKGKMDALNSPAYSQSSMKITITGHDDNVELTQYQLDLLKDFKKQGFKPQMASGGKPTVVRIEDKSLNKTSTYVIVKTIGDLMVGVPYDEHESTPPEVTPTTTPRPVIHKPGKPQRMETDTATHHPTTTITTTTTTTTMRSRSRPQGVPGTRTSFRPEALFRSCLEPLPPVPPLLLYMRPQGAPYMTEHPYHGGFMTESPPLSVQNYEATTQLPTTTLGPNYFQNEEALTDRPYLHNQGPYSNKCTDQTGSWIGEEILPEAEFYRSTQDYEGLGNTAASNGPYNDRKLSYWQMERNPPTMNTAPKSVQELHKRTHHNVDSNDQFRMNTDSSYNDRYSQPRTPNATPYDPMPQIGNARHRTPRERPLRLQHDEMPENMSAPPQKYNPTTGVTHPRQTDQHFKTDIVPNSPTNHYNIHHTVNREPGHVQNVDFQTTGRATMCQQRVPPWEQNLQTPNSNVYGAPPPQRISGDNYREPYYHRACPGPMALSFDRSV